MIFSNFIELQEAEGQRTLVTNCFLPKDEERYIEATGFQRIYAKPRYKAMGIEIIEDVNDLFFRVKLPEGWSLKATDHTMWNELIDDQGKTRAEIFYKAAFYDRNAFIRFKS